MSAVQTSSVGLERFDNALNQLCQLNERRDNRFTLKGLSRCKGYAERRYELLAQFDVFRGGDRKQYLAVLNGRKSRIDECGNGALSTLNGEIWNSGEFGGRDKRCMFISDVEPVEAVKIAFPTRIGFQVFDKCDDLFGGKVYLSLFDSSYKGVSVLNEGELHFVGLGSQGDDDIGDHQVQCGSEVVNDIANDDCEILRNVFADSHSPEVIPGLRIFLNDNCIWISGIKSLDSRVQLRDMLLGPFNL